MSLFGLDDEQEPGLIAAAEDEGGDATMEDEAAARAAFRLQRSQVKVKQVHLSPAAAESGPLKADGG